MPNRPSVARRSAEPVKASVALPETSAKPPSPPSRPPCAEMVPEKPVKPSDQTMTRPPSPLAVASARIAEPASIVTVWARGSAPLP